MSDTWFTSSPDWTWFIIPYFFIGGIAGGAYFLAALLEWFGDERDRTVIRTAYYVAALGAIVSGLLLIIDLDRPTRFWHMLFQSEEFPRLMFKWWSPISFGAWGLLLFGAFATSSALGALAEEGRLRWPPLHSLYRNRTVARIVAAFGAAFGLFLAGYTGVLLSVTNRPIWADSDFVGLLFLVSGASTAAATLVLLGNMRGAHRASIQWLFSFGAAALVLEFAVLTIFLISLGDVARVWVSAWGLLLLVGVVGAGILLPLGLHWRPKRFGRWGEHPLFAASVLVLVGGFLLRVVILLASHEVGS
ncbi:MAG: NrfD/PsrC family molybdoenzyme membrane anchor subunit [Gemmatimonadota bacterium]